MSATRYYGRVTAPASERVMLESLGVEVAPLRAEDAADFSAAAGYSAEDRRAIAALQVGQTWESPDYGRAHYVIRLPDHGPSLDPARMQVIWNDFVSLDGGDPAQWNATAARPASSTQARGADDDLQP